MSLTAPDVKTFVLDYLREIEAEVVEENGVYTVNFPLGRKRKFGRTRRFVFESEKVQPQVELLEPGSPLLKLLLLDAKQWGGLGAYHDPKIPVGTMLFTFQFTSFSSLRKRLRFAHAILLPEATEAEVREGVPEVFVSGAALPVVPPRGFERLQNALPMLLPRIEQAGRDFAEDAIVESRDEFEKSMGRVTEYFQNLKTETFAEEARIRKRLGEIQSKLYFTEDGLRQLKLERERDRLTQELHALKKRQAESQDKLVMDQSEHVERQRRRHEPKLHIRLVAATLIGPTPAPGEVVAYADPTEAQDEPPIEAPDATQETTLDR